MALTKVIGSGVGELTNKVGLGLSSPAAALHVQTSTDGTGLSGDDIYVARFQNQEATSDKSFGVDIQAGSSTTDQALRIKDHDGTNTFMIVDGLGHVTKPLQPSFQVRKSADQSNVSASDSVVTVSFDTEVFDVNSNFASNTFTAPVTGKYFLSINAYLGQIDTDAGYILIGIRTSNRDYYRLVDPNFSADLNYYGMNFSVLADLDASDTAFIWWQSNGGTAQVDILAANGTQFQGCLLS